MTRVRDSAEVTVSEPVQPRLRRRRSPSRRRLPPEARQVPERLVESALRAADGDPARLEFVPEPRAVGGYAVLILNRPRGS